MRRGTTPTHTITVDVDLTDAEVIYLDYRQKNKIVLEKTKDDMTVEEGQIQVKLTQAETLAFSDDTVTIQLRARFADGTAVASNFMRIDVSGIIKDGEI